MAGEEKSIGKVKASTLVYEYVDPIPEVEWHLTGQALYERNRA